MNKLLAGFLSLSLFITPVLADKGNDPFYDSGVGLWRVLGLFPSKEHNHGYGCVMMSIWPDETSSFALIHDHENSALGLEVTYNYLDFQGDDGDDFEGRLVFKKTNGAKKVFSMQYKKTGKHSLTVESLDATVFLEPMASYNSLTVVLAEGNGFELDLRDSKKALGQMKECWEESKKYRSSQDM